MASGSTLRSPDQKDYGTRIFKCNEKEMEEILTQPYAAAMTFMDYSPETIYNLVKSFQEQGKKLESAALMREAEKLKLQTQPISPRVKLQQRFNSLGSDGESEGESLEYVDANSEFTSEADKLQDASGDLQTDSELDRAPTDYFKSATKRHSSKSLEEAAPLEMPPRKLPDKRDASSDSSVYSERKGAPVVKSGQGAMNVQSKNQDEQLRKLQMLMMENRRLKTRQRCRNCHEKPVGITFLPCGHYSYCYECGQQFNACPICKRTILADVRTFMA